MTVYPTYTKSEAVSVFWPEPLETIWQSLPSGSGTTLAPKLRHLSDWEALCLAPLPLIPRDRRPHGIITWAAEMFAVSRPSIYALGSGYTDGRCYPAARLSRHHREWSRLSPSPKTMSSGSK